MEVHIHSLKLLSKDSFAKKFNQVSDLFAKWQEEAAKEENSQQASEAFQLYFEAKFRLESGQ